MPRNRDDEAMSEGDLSSDSKQLASRNSRNQIRSKIDEDLMEIKRMLKDLINRIQGINDEMKALNHKIN